MIPKPAPVGLALLSACALGLATLPARADVTLEERISVEGSGLMRMAGMSGSSRTVISGDRARMESDMQMQSRLVRKMARGLGPTADIVRLDEGKVYQLDIKKKQYTESSFEETRSRLEAMRQKAQEAQQTSPSPIDESECEWSEPKAEVKRTGETASFAGHSAQRLSITASQSCRNKSTGAVCDVALSLDQWLAPNFAPGSEALKFQRAYAQQLGLDAAVSRDLGERAKSMFGRYAGVWSKIAEQTRGVEGYPVKSSFALAVGGPQCQQAQGEADGAAPAPGGITGQIVGSIFGRKKAQEQQATPAAAALPADMVPLIIMSSELTAVSNEPVAPETFTVPADFTRVTASTP